MVKLWIRLAVFLIFLSGCVSVQNRAEQKTIHGHQSVEKRFPTSDFENLGRTFEYYFENRNYIERIQNIKSLATHLQKLMSLKEHPRQFVLEKFIFDLDQELENLNQAERDLVGLNPSWLPNSGSENYSQKMNSMEKIIHSANVMIQIDRIAEDSKILADFEDGEYEHNLYQGLLRSAIKSLDLEYQKVRAYDLKLKHAAVFGFTRMIADTARIHVHKYFKREEKSDRIKVESYLNRISKVTMPTQALSLMGSSEFQLAKFYLANNESSAESDIEGFEAVKRAKIATLVGLETIVHLWTQLNTEEATRHD